VSVTKRTCQTCRHFEPAAIWRHGWCRNPRLYGPTESHLVAQGSLDCARGLGCHWEPRIGAEATADRRAIRPVALFAPQPSLATAGGVVLASAGGGPAPRPGGGSSRPERPLVQSQQERAVSFQPEERYWTDYLRIALPVMGLVLLVTLLWWWMGNIIGSPGDEPPPTQAAVAAITPINAATPPPVPTATPETVALTPGPPPPTATVAAVPPPAPTAAPEPTAAPTQPPAEAAEDPANPCANLPPFYEVGTTVETTDNVNLREGPSTETPVVTTLPAETQLTIAGEFSEQGQCDWWPVSNPETGQEGFVREDFLRQPS